MLSTSGTRSPNVASAVATTCAHSASASAASLPPQASAAFKIATEIFSG